MKLFKLIIPLFVLSFLAFNGLASDDTKPPVQSPPGKADKATKVEKIEWFAYDIGLKKAKKENKHVFIDFTAKWCGYCKKMEREAFSDSNVIKILNNDFVAVKVDGDSKKMLDIDGYKITEKNLTRHDYGVRGYPTFWFLKSDGTKLTNLRGYRTTDFITGALNYIKDYKYDSTRANTSE
ncbi:MAG: thioredoxin family protein [Candidatus Zixiibacteriota bacterium]